MDAMPHIKPHNEKTLELGIVNCRFRYEIPSM